MTQFNRGVLDVFLDGIGREIRRIVQHDADFLAELFLKCGEPANRRLAVEVSFTWQEERLAFIRNGTE